MNKRSGIKTKQKILDAAKRVFSRYGYSGASIRLIARAAGASVGGVYLYFKNKDELYLGLLKERIENHLRATRAVVAAAGSPGAALLAFLRINLDYAARNRKLILTDVREHRFAFGMAIKRRSFREQTGIVAAIIAEGVRHGEFSPCRTVETAAIVMAALRGIVLSLVLDNDQAVTAKGLYAFLLQGLLKRRDAAVHGRVSARRFPSRTKDAGQEQRP